MVLKERESRERGPQKSRRREMRGSQRVRLHRWVSVLGTTQGRKSKANITNRL